MTVNLSVTPPSWFTTAVGDRPEFRSVVVAGATVGMRCWGPDNAPGMVLVHGGSAHSGWWDHIGPMLALNHRIVALDLSGHGDSDARPKYPMDLWADEAIAAAKAGGISGEPYVVGHSMGGWVAATAGVRHGNSIRGIVIIDSPLIREIPEVAIAGLLSRTPRTYASKDEIRAKFRTEPPQDNSLAYVLHHVADESIQRTDAGWAWKFDPDMLRKRHRDSGLLEAQSLVPNLSVATVFVRCELGMVTLKMAADIARLFDQRATMVDLADAGHHPMMDQPLALVAILRTVIAQWDRCPW